GLMTNLGMRTIRSAATLPSVVATTLGTAELNLSEIPWQQVMEDVGQALLRASRSVLNLPEAPRPQAPRRRVPGDDPPEETSAPTPSPAPEAEESPPPTLEEARFPSPQPEEEEPYQGAQALAGIMVVVVQQCRVVPAADERRRSAPLARFVK